MNRIRKATEKIPKVEHGERFNTLSHGMGTVFALIGSIILLWMAAQKPDSWKIFSFTVYAVTTVGLYFISTLYHAAKGSKKHFLRRLDYIGIYLKIAGAYTPFAILALRGAVGWAILAAVWTMALLGVLLEVFFFPKKRRESLALCCLMAITVLPALKVLMDAIPFYGFLMILAGFVAYGIGILFFVNDEKIKHGHGIWHLCVMAGTAMQFLCVLIYLT